MTICHSFLKNYKLSNSKQKSMRQKIKNKNEKDKKSIKD